MNTLGKKGLDFSRVTRVVVVQNLVQVPANTTSPTPLPVKFTTPGVVLWLLAAPANASSADQYYGALTSLGLRINVQGRSEFITNGESADYSQFSALMPSAGFRFPVNIEVLQNDTWQVYIRNTNTGNAYTPSVAFGLAEI